MLSTMNALDMVLYKINIVIVGCFSISCVECRNVRQSLWDFAHHENPILLWITNMNHFIFSIQLLSMHVE